MKNKSRKRGKIEGNKGREEEGERERVDIIYVTCVAIKPINHLACLNEKY